MVGAGLLARTVYNLQHADLGFTARQALLVRVDFREAGYQPAQKDSVLRALLGEIQLIPGVRTASFSQLGVFSGGESGTTIEVEGYAPTDGQDIVESRVDVVGPGYFSTLGIPIRLGRDILESDRGEATRVCVINEAFAKRFFDRRNPSACGWHQLAAMKAGRLIRWSGSRATPIHKACGTPSRRATSWRDIKRSIR